MSTERQAFAGAYPIRFKAKPPGAVLDYALDFALMSVDRAPVTLLDVVWTIVGLPGDAKPLVIDSQALTAGVSTVRLSAGTPLAEYQVRGQCAWSDGETDVVSFALPIDYLPNADTLFPSGIPSAELFGLPTVT